MPNRTSKSLYRLLRGSLPSSVVEHARQLSRIERAVLSALPDQFVSHCRIANLRHGELLLWADSPAWAAKLRYLIPGLQSAILETLQIEIRHTTIQIDPVAERRPAEGKNRSITEVGSNHLEQAAATTDYPPLRNALNRLARHGRKKSR